MMKFLLVSFLALTLLLTFGCESDSGVVEEEMPEEEVDAENDDVADVEVPKMISVEVPPQLDGSGEGFASEPFRVAGADIYLAHDEDLLYVHMEAEAEGWLAVGFNTQGGGMNSANMIIGYLDDGVPTYRDDVGQGHRHSEIGSPAVVDFYFNVENGSAVMALSYPLDFQSEEGFNLESLAPGETYTMIAAVHSSTYNISNPHSTRGSVDFTVEP